MTSGLGALLIYLTIGEKNATVASLIEMSYPLFVAFFAWLFFCEIQFNRLTVAGEVLILSGVALGYFANRRSAILAGVPDSENVDRGVLDLVTEFVAPNQ